MSRFVVRAVRGFEIKPHAPKGGGRSVAPVSWQVLDSAVCYRLMAEYPPVSSGGGNSRLTAEVRRREAEAYAAKLEHDCALAEAGRVA